MAYLVRWQLVGRSGRPLDGGCIREFFPHYGDAVTAISDFLRPYPEVCRCGDEGYWQARRSADADLAVWVWVEWADKPSALDEVLASSFA
jgi:hypothetical protein